jgi:hypothetical protein
MTLLEAINVLGYENITMYGVLIGIITYLLKEKTDLNKVIADMRTEIAQIQAERMEENKKMIELSLELISKIKQYGVKSEK